MSIQHNEERHEIRYWVRINHKQWKVIMWIKAVYYLVFCTRCFHCRFLKFILFIWWNFCSKQQIQQIIDMIKQIREGALGRRSKRRILMSNFALHQQAAFWRSLHRILEMREITSLQWYKEKGNLMNFTEVKVILNSLNLHSNLLLFLMKNPWE